MSKSDTSAIQPGVADQSLRMSFHTSDQVRRHLTILIVIALLLIAIYPLLTNSSYISNADFHSTIEMVGALLGIIAGFALITHYYSLGNQFYLFVGLAFFINGSEDFIHGLMAYPQMAFFTGVPASTFKQFIPGTYVTGRILMGAILIFAPLSVRWLKETRNPKFNAIMVSGVVIFASALLTAIAFKIPLPKFIYPDRFISRPVDLVSAILFSLAFISFLMRYRQTRNVLTWWVLLSIAVNVIGQLMMSVSKELFDAFFDIAHVYKVIG